MTPQTTIGGLELNIDRNSQRQAIIPSSSSKPSTHDFFLMKTGGGVPLPPKSACIPLRVYQPPRIMKLVVLPHKATAACS